MIYYVYFDPYRRPRRAIGEEELREKFDNDPDRFLKAMGSGGKDGAIEGSAGHVGIMHFEDEKELRDFFETTGEEISGFYECRSESRPYNF